MFLLMQIELLQTHLEFHQWLQQLQSVTRYTSDNTALGSVPHIQPVPNYVTKMDNRRSIFILYILEGK